MKWLQTSTLLIVAVCLVLSGCVRKRHQTDDAAESGESQQADTATVDDSPVAAEQSSSTPVADSATPPDAAPAPESAPATDPTVAASTETPAAPASTAGTGELGTYSVQKGDTLMKIAFNLYGDIDKWNDIFQMNKDQLHGMGKLQVGQVLKYDKPASAPVVSQNGDPYMIKNGDTLGKIADDVYGKPKKWKAIYENNRQLIKDPNRIFAGFYLYYQITEEERQEATRLKASRSQTMGATAAPAVGSPAADAAVMPSAPAAPAAEAPVNTSALSPQGTATRMPASRK